MSKSDKWWIAGFAAFMVVLFVLLSLPGYWTQEERLACKAAGNVWIDRQYVCVAGVKP